MRLSKILIFCFFFENFLNVTLGCPLHFLMFCNKLDFQKTQKVPLYTFFGIVSLFNVIISRFIFFSVFKRFALF